jgi:hypothetical protein
MLVFIVLVFYNAKLQKQQARPGVNFTNLMAQKRKCASGHSLALVGAAQFYQQKYAQLY